MKKILLFLIAIVIVVSCKTTKHNSDFRGLRWGATQDEVIKLEGRKPDATETNLLIYTAKLSGVPMMLGYRFVDNKLAAATYIPQNAGSMQKEINDAYINISDSLTKVYGASRDSLMDEGAKVRKTWQTPSTEIFIIYYMQSIMLEYSSKTYKPLLMQQQNTPKQDEEPLEKE